MKLKLLSLVTLAALSSPSFASLIMAPKMVPLEPVLKSAETNLADNPESDEARYNLARIHYLAFALSSETVPVGHRGSPASDKEIETLKIEKRLDTLEPSKHAAHASASLAGFRELVKKNPQNGLYHFGLASLFEQIVDWKERAKPAELPEALKEVTRAHARDAYLAAFRANLGEIADIKVMPMGVFCDGFVSYKAGKEFLRMATAESDKSPDLQALMKEVQEALTKMEAIPKFAPQQLAPRSI